ncbi:MAG: hypothetical protein ACRD6X_04545 [Pyrinomonadaceae bacterium]
MQLLINLLVQEFDSVKIFVKVLFLFAVLSVFALSAVSCSVEASKPGIDAVKTDVAAKSESAPKGATIQIKPGSPADTVRAFYAKLREKKFREAIFLTNLRPAIEGLTDDELKEFAVDFEAIANKVPAEIEINGEIISGDNATVTAKLPDENLEKLEFQQLRLRKEGENWIILSADDETEMQIKKEGKNYFLALRIETHQEEAKKMLNRIAKAQMVHSLQNGGKFAEFPKLIADGILPPDITTSETTGYNFVQSLSTDALTYRVSATPAVYGKSGKLSFLLDLDKDDKPRVKSGDNGGKPIPK